MWCLASPISKRETERRDESLEDNDQNLVAASFEAENLAIAATSFKVKSGF